MKRATNTILHLPWYVFLFSVYPVLSLYAQNVTEVQNSYLWRPLATSLVGTFLALLVCRLLFKNWYMASIVTSIATIMFFAYGHVYIGLKNISLAIPFVRHRLLLPIWAILFVIGIWMITRGYRQPERATSVLNLVAIIALLFPIVQTGNYLIHQRGAEQDVPRRGFAGLVLPADQRAPDIYYIILDAYGNTQTLTELMDFDNAEFLDALRNQGFYVANCSQSNYASTQLSLVSSLNLDYLTAFGDAFVPGSGDDSNLSAYLKGNATRYTLDALGYQIIAFETGFAWSEWYDADLYLSLSRTLWRGYNEFEDLLVKTTALRALYDMNILLKPDEVTSPHYERVLYVLESLKVLPSMPGPKFVFVHLLMPHDPFDFNEDGTYFTGSWSSGSREPYFEGYRRQVIYISKVIPEVTASIIANSPTPPVIIIQGDHGPSYYYSDVERMGILNAYYLPNGSEFLYETITPVNTFRILFNAYFGGNFDLLEDVSYMSISIDDPFTVTEVTNPCMEK
ncbi:MAG: hypothetical protein AB1531_12370 [Chloroflexota bacterium]